MPRFDVHRRLTYANVMATLAVIIAITGSSTAVAAVIISSNSEVAQDTISGHKPPAGDHANILSGSVNATDLANKSVTAAKIKPPEPWHAIGSGSGTQDLCFDPSHTAVFCSLLLDPGLYEPWRNYGSGFATAAFYKDQLGIVHLRGLVAISSSTSSLFFQSNNPAFAAFFRLPAGYRPSNVRVFPSEGRGGGQLDVAASRIDVQPDGLVVLEQDCSSDFESCSADGEYVTLEGISFRPDE